jgi:hypothetical protein
MKEIQLTKGYVALVDDEDFERVSQFKWHAQISCHKDGSIRTVYANRSVRNVYGIRAKQPLSSFILEIDTGLYCIIDHKDGNGLNHQKLNLRKASKSQNGQNQQLSIRNTSGFKGVHWSSTAEKWQTIITVNGEVLNLGYFSDKKDAAQAYNEAATKHFGEFAALNQISGEFK